MRKRVLSEKELQQVIELQEKKCSWLGIQTATGIPRHAAKRDYEQWKKKQTVVAFEGIRKQLAEEEFKKHVGHLMRMAELIPNYVTVLHQAYVRSSSADQLREMLEFDNIVDEPVSEDDYEASPEYFKKKWAEYNSLLLEALKVHISDKVGDAIGEWARAWDNCLNFLKELDEWAHEAVDRIVRQDSDIDRDSVARSVVIAIANIVLEGRMPTDMKDSQIAEAVAHDRDQDWKIIESLHQHVAANTKVSLEEHSRISKDELDRKKLDILEKVAEELYEKKIRPVPLAKRFVKVQEMKRAVNKLHEWLHPLKLRPQILRTRCDLCPV